MVWRDGGAPGRSPDFGSGQTAQSAATPTKAVVLLVVMTFLLVTIALVALQPDRDPQPVFSAAVEPLPEPVEVPAPTPEPVEIAEPLPEPPVPVPSPVVAQEVTRADASLLELRQAVQSTEASHVLRQLGARAGAGPSDLPLLARRVLGGFGYVVRDGDRLHALLVSSLAEDKSDAYIDALLNTAAARGEFTPPFALLQPTGRMDTSSLLAAMVRTAEGP